MGEAGAGRGPYWSGGGAALGPVVGRGAAPASLSTITFCFFFNFQCNFL